MMEARRLAGPVTWKRTHVASQVARAVVSLRSSRSRDPGAVLLQRERASPGLAPAVVPISACSSNLRSMASTLRAASHRIPVSASARVLPSSPFVALSAPLWSPFARPRVVVGGLGNTPTSGDSRRKSLTPSLFVGVRIRRAERLRRSGNGEWWDRQRLVATAAAMAENLKDLSLKDGTVADKAKSKDDEAPASSGRKKLEELNWDHSFVRELPGDERIGGPTRQVLHACYSKVSPSVLVKNPELVAWSKHVADLLDLDYKEFERPDFPSLFTGASELKDGLSYAQCYGGHQFGVWAGQLGDGRAITLGELSNSKGERWELQLKGAGKTPYSRTADGLAVLRSSVREFLCSEAMYYLGVPTTRALSLVTTGEGVLRDMFYDGNVKMEPGAVVCRVAPSFIRFGTFQIHAARDKTDLPIVKQLADYTIHYHYPEFENLPFERQGVEGSSESPKGENNAPVIDVSKNKYAAWFIEIAERTAVLIAKWQAVGFTHGVMNTDNMSILGLTIDYGPFGFLDAFDPKYTPNTTDLPGRRYGFANQPDIGLWNVMQLANTLYTAELITADESQFGLGRYADKFMCLYQQHMSSKIGLKSYNKDLLSKLLSNMAFDKVDYTNFFRSLGNVKAAPTTSDDNLIAPLKNSLLDLSKERRKVWLDWLHQYVELVVAEGVPEAERKAGMDSVNPRYVLRNYLLQSAIDLAEVGDYSEVDMLLKLMQRPYDDQPGMEKYARLPPAWAYRPGVCMLSCSS